MAIAKRKIYEERHYTFKNDPRDFKSAAHAAI
jgi:hypothetical protein